MLMDLLVKGQKKGKNSFHEIQLNCSNSECKLLRDEIQSACKYFVERPCM